LLTTMSIIFRYDTLTPVMSIRKIF
jgi:hypothetical protein